MGKEYLPITVERITLFCVILFLFLNLIFFNYVSYFQKMRKYYLKFSLSMVKYLDQTNGIRNYIEIFSLKKKTKLFSGWNMWLCFIFLNVIENKHSLNKDIVHIIDIPWTIMFKSENIFTLNIYNIDNKTNIIWKK